MCIRDSYTSGTYDKVRERQLKAKELYKALQEFQCTEETSPLVRFMAIFDKNRGCVAIDHRPDAHTPHPTYVSLP